MPMGGKCYFGVCECGILLNFVGFHIKDDRSYILVSVNDMFYLFK